LTDRVVWLVDAAYLLKAAPGHFDYLLLRNVLEETTGCRFSEIFYFNSTPNPPTDQMDAFHTWLKSAPPRGPKLRVKLYKLKDLHLDCPSCHNSFDRPVQKGVDVGIATMAIKMAALDQYDTLLLSTGDGDFEDAIKYVKEERRKRFWLAGFDGSVSADLQSYADDVFWLGLLWDRFKKP
jgi:uncharacterized LabA/DUF88 family protein